MAKVLFLIASGEEARDKANAGIIMAARSVEAKRYEDLKVLFFGPSEDYLTKLTGPALDHFKKLNDAGAVDSACVAIARNGGIEQKLTDLGVKLLPAGERVSFYVNGGYQVITF